MFFILLGELIVLYFIADRLQKSLFRFFYLLSGSRTVSISIVTAILFPGTVVHELAHLLVAEILGVKTGKLTLAPESTQGENIQAGSITMVKTDPLRKAIIGISPLFVCLIFVTLLSYWMPEVITHLSTTWSITTILTNSYVYILLFLLYLLFTITNSMFPSSIDVKGFPAVAVVLSLLLGATYFVGFRFSLTGESLRIVETILKAVIQSLGLVLAINGVLLLTTKILIILIGKIHHHG